MFRKKKTKGLLCVLLCFMIGITTIFTGCSQKTSKEGDYIRIMLMGNKPIGFDEVLVELNKRISKELGFTAKFDWINNGDYRQKVNLKMIAGEDYDLMFDAPWCRLRNFAREGFYADLAPYLHNDKYPGLKENFSEVRMENNRYYGKNYYFPLEQAYGSGINGIAYRRDLSDKYGIGKIDSYEKLQQYFEAIQANEEHMVPMTVSQSRGFYNFYTLNGNDLADANIQRLKVGCTLYVLLNEDQTAVKEIVPEGAGDEAFNNFPEGYNYDFGMDRYRFLQEWNKYLDKDSLACLDCNTPFFTGQSAAICSTTSEWYDFSVKTKSYIPEAEVDMFIENPHIANMEQGAIETSYLANNCICIPDVSEKKEMAIKFLDWVFGDDENNALLTYGIEGVDWEAVSDNTYRSLGTSYAFPGYTLTWHPSFVKFDADIPEEQLVYREYALKEESYRATPLAGLVLDQVVIETEIAKVNAVNSKISSVLAHGVCADGYDSLVDMKQDNIKDCYKKGLDVIIKEVERQINEFLANKNA